MEPPIRLHLKAAQFIAAQTIYFTNFTDSQEDDEDIILQRVCFQIEDQKERRASLDEQVPNTL